MDKIFIKPKMHVRKVRKKSEKAYFQFSLTIDPYTLLSVKPQRLMLLASCPQRGEIKFSTTALHKAGEADSVLILLAL